MSMIKCSECGSEISTEAMSCPNCGAPGLAGLRAKSNQTALTHDLGTTDNELDLHVIEIVNGIPNIAWMISASERRDLTEPAIAEQFLADESPNVQPAKPLRYGDFFTSNPSLAGQRAEMEAARARTQEPKVDPLVLEPTVAPPDVDESKQQR